jgi:hypothetical protein
MKRNRANLIMNALGGHPAEKLAFLALARLQRRLGQATRHHDHFLVVAAKGRALASRSRIRPGASISLWYFVSAG